MVNALAGLAAGADFAQGLQNTYDNSRLNMLSGRAYSAPQADRSQLLGQMASISPQAAQAQQQQWQADEDRQTRMLVNTARYMKGALDRKDPAAVAGAWSSVRPALIRAGLATEQELSPTWDPSYEQTVHQVLAMGSPDATGGVLQSQKIGADGYIYNSFRDGRMVNTGVKADRQAWFRDQPGFAPEVVNKDGTTTQIGGSPAGDAGPQGTTFTTSEGQPFDVSLVTDPYLRQEITRDPGSYGMVPDGARAALPSRELTPSQYNSRTRPSAAQEAAAVEAARQQAQLAYLPTELGLRTQADIAKAQGVEQAKSAVEAEAKRRSLQVENNRSFNLYEAAMQGVTEGLGGTTTGPLMGRLPAVTADQQKAEGAVSAIAPILKQLFRSAGEGTFTDKDQELLLAMIPTRTDHAEARNWKIANIDRIIREKLGQPADGVQQAGAPMPAARAQQRMAPRVGTVEGGYRYKGGNPADPNSWERM